MKGWIAIHRSLWRSELFSEKEEACEKFAWIDMIQQANWKAKQWRDGSRVVMVPRGSFVTSILTLSERWNWSRGRVRRFLNCLKSGHQIVTESDSRTNSRWTLITLVNYDNYQRVIDSREVDADEARTANETTNGQQTFHAADTTEQGSTKKQRNKGESARPQKVSFGDHFKATTEQHAALVAEWGAPKVAEYIKRFNGYCEASGKKYSNHIQAIRNWEESDQKKPRPGLGYQRPKSAAEITQDTLNAILNNPEID